MTQLKIHDVRFYRPELRAIYAMALEPDTDQLAVSRSDASLEIWNISNAHFIERTISSTVDNFSIEGLAWYCGRLFSVGLHGLLIEYNLRQLGIKSRNTITGEAALCLDIDRKNGLIGVGSENGYLNIFQINDDGVAFDRFFDKQEGRIICLKFNATGDFIVSGSIDTIRIWNVSTGHAIHKMTLSRAETRKETIVWSLCITDDFTIFSGDSRGVLTLWDGHNGAQIVSHQSHKADILTISLNEKQNTLFCAGVDPAITNFVRITSKGEAKKWVKSIQRKIHDNDVRTMVLNDEKLYSAGLDGYLVCSYQPKTLIKLPPILRHPVAYISRSARYITLRHSNHIEVWSLGQCKTVDDDFRGAVDIEKEPKKLLVLSKLVKNWSGEEQGEAVMCCAVSDDGEWIFFGTSGGVALYEANFENETPSLTKVYGFKNDKTRCSHAAFTPDNLQLIVATVFGDLEIYDLKYDQTSLNCVIHTSNDLTDTLSHLVVTNCGKFIIASDVQSNIMIWTNKIGVNSWKLHCKLPKYSCPPTAMACHPKLLYLVVAYSDQKIVEYDIKSRQFTRFSKRFDSKSQTGSKTYPINCITFDERVSNVILINDDSNLYVINKGSQKSPAKEAKQRKISSSDGANNEIDSPTKDAGTITCVKKYKHLVHFDSLASDEMVAVEVNPLHLLEQLPPAFNQNTFGNK